MSFATILTNIGLSKLAEALVTGSTITLTHMAVGDGDNSPTTPNAAQTGLVNERYRAAIAQKAVDPVNQNKLILDLQVPTAQGGWTIHEVGLFDDEDDLIAVANFPATYKPLP